MRYVHALRRRARDLLEIVLLYRSGRARDSRAERGDTIVLTGWYGTETVGDQAILGGVLDVIRETHSGDVLIASLDPSVTRATLRMLGAGDRVTTATYADARTLIDAGRARLVAMAGGPVMGPIDPILDLSLLHRRARRNGTPDVFLGSGVGPLGRPLRRRVIAALLRDSKCITVRDRTSASNVARLTGRDAAVSRDPALVWLARYARDEPATTRGERAKRVALALRHWPLHEFADGRADHTDRERLEEELRGFASLAADEGWHIDPIAMGFLEVGGDDRRFLRELLGAPLVTDEFVNAAPSPASVASQMLAADVVVAMRFHACLFGLALGRPVVAVDYTLGDKIASLGKEFGGNIQVLDPRTLDAGSLGRAVESAAVASPFDLQNAAAVCRETLAACLATADV